MPVALEDRLHHLLAAYVGAPQWVKTVVGAIYSRLPSGMRRGAAYDHFHHVAGQRDRQWLNDYVRKELSATLTWAAETVPAYRHLRDAVKPASDPVAVLATFPLTGKAEIKAAPIRYVSSGAPAAKRLPTFTGGSTAEPMLFYLEKDVTRAREYAFMDDFHLRLGYREGDLVLALRGRTVPTAAKEGGRLWMYEPIKRQIILSSDHLLARWMPDYVELLKQWRPRFIQAFPSALYPLARWLAENPTPAITDNIQGVMLYSENVYDYQMRLFRQVFGCPVLKHYGHSERVLMAASMPDDDRYFFWPQYGYLELVDKVGEPISEPGVVGEIIGTSFDNRVMPFIRYRTGDLAMWSARPVHPALAGFPVLEKIEGRLQEFVVCRDGRLISICSLGAAHFEELAQVEAIQYEQTVQGRLLLKVMASSRLTEKTKQRIATAIENKTQGGCVAEILEVDDIPRTRTGKQVMLIQKIGNP